MEDLQERCPECNGTGHIGEHSCGICYGRGRVPTPAGQAILELVETFGGKPLDTIAF